MDYLGGSLTLIVMVLVLLSVFCSPGTGGISTLRACLAIETLVVSQLKVTVVEEGAKGPYHNQHRPW